MTSSFRIPIWLYALFAGAMILALIFHWQHVLAYAPFIFILACPLMHLFHGHGGHDQAKNRKNHSHHDL
ncbi:MAG TPA: DUF2933 domain-containing protein [Candidatus Peribacteraceae bacterium]|nr:DUF2933 domain-containing protein [Candidatus Peribacteraceae bacterium]